MDIGLASLIAEVEEHFRFLFVEHGFSVAFAREIDAASYFVVIRSNKMSIKVLQHQGDLEFNVGPPSAPPTWSDRSTEGQKCWYNPYVLCDFQESRVDPDHKRLLEGPLDCDTAEVMNDWAGWLRSNMKHLVAFFETSSSVERLFGLAEFERERRARIRSLITTKILTREIGEKLRGVSPCKNSTSDSSGTETDK